MLNTLTCNLLFCRAPISYITIGFHKKTHKEVKVCLLKIQLLKLSLGRCRSAIYVQGGLKFGAWDLVESLKGSIGFLKGIYRV